MFTLEIETSGAAFDSFPGYELARILRELADRFEDGVPASGVLIDVNGNTTGTYTNRD